MGLFGEDIRSFFQLLLRFANVSTLQSFYLGRTPLEHLPVEVELLFIPSLLEDVGFWLHVTPNPCAL